MGTNKVNSIIKSCKDCFIAQLVNSTCSTLTDDDQRLLWAHSDLVQVKAGKSIDGHIGGVPAIVSVCAGSVGVRYGLSDGRQAISTLYSPGDIIDLRDLPADTHSKVIALTDAFLCLHDSEAFETLVRRNQSLSAIHYRNIRKQLRRSEARCLDLARKTPVERVATFLMDRSGQETRPPDRPVTLHTFEKRADIADYLGLQPETLSRVLARLQFEGFIKLVGRQIIVLQDPAGLAKIAQGGRPRLGHGPRQDRGALA
ncbi:MAG: Crp/Fnr family transcriptional regulator [Pseudomonadota bacterium]